MQYKDNRTILLAETVGEVIRELRVGKNYSINKFANEYGLDIGNTSRVEKGKTDIKFVTLWKIAESLGVKPSVLVSMVEQKLNNKEIFLDD